MVDFLLVSFLVCGVFECVCVVGYDDDARDVARTRATKSSSAR